MAIDEIKDKIIHARVRLLLQHPFFGNMATRLKVIENNEWCKTAATDGTTIYYNRDFFNSLSAREIEFVFAHEVLHNVFDHFARRGHRNQKLFNIANDFVVNGQLVRDKIGSMPKLDLCHDEKYYGKSSEEVYELLYDDWDKKSLEALGNLLDQHIDWESDDGDGRPVYTKDQLRGIRDGVRDATFQAAQAAGAGNTPDAVKRLIKELTEPQMNWRELLRQNLQSLIRNDYTFARPNRKSQHLDAILPGTNYDQTVDICVALDMSGSISNEQACVFLSEIKGIMEEFRDFKIKVFCFDTDVYNEADFDQFSLDEFETYQPIGGGGTDFMAFFKYMIDNDYVPNRLVVFTDLYPCGSWGVEDYCETLWIGHGTQSIVPPFGQVTYFDE